MSETSRFKPDDEPGRLAALRRYGVLDSDSEKEFDDIVALVKSVFAMPYAAVNLIDTDRQWTKASAGINLRQCVRDDSFCTYTVRSLDPLSIENASRDPRFINNPFVAGDAHIRCYLGAPLTTPDGYNIGALCVFGTEPRVFTEPEKVVLMNFAKVVVSQLELRQAASRDVLTGALTRRSFEDRVAQIVKDNLVGSLILLDIDHFKSINDTFGHPAGDQALQEVVSCIVKCVQGTDSIGRVGGEEFGVLLPHAASTAATILAERICTAVMQETHAALEHRRLTVSLGVAQRHDAETSEDWIKRTDKALYEAKRSGRNKVVKAG